MKKASKVDLNKVAEAIAQFEIRTGGLMPRIGESIEVSNLRESTEFGPAYLADYVKRVARNPKDRWRTTENEKVETVSTFSKDNLYFKDYMDFLAKSPSFNQ